MVRDVLGSVEESTKTGREETLQRTIVEGRASF